MDVELWKHTAAKLASAIARGEVSATEVISSHLERITEINSTYNAVTQVFADTALEAARDVDQQRAAGQVLGPLAGVPFTVKENIDVAGTATTLGVPVLKNAVVTADAPLVERLRRAGAIPLAHTNLPDLSLRFHTYSQLYGHTVNPWDPSRSPGGSSGGEGVALGTGMSPLELGNDAGGSVRLPALFGGVAALKPSYGRLPADQSVGSRDLTLASQLIPVSGVFARSVVNLRLAFELLAGPDSRDPRAVPAPLDGPFLAAPIRVAVCPDPGGLGVQPEVVGAVELAASALEDAGYLIETVDVPRLADTLEAYGQLIMTEFGMVWPMLERLLGPDGRRYIELAMNHSKPVDFARYVELSAVRMGLQRDWAQFLERYPLVLGPSFTELAIPVDFDIQGVSEFARFETARRLCTATSFVGLPAVAVPTGVVGKLPQGVQVIAAQYREDLCLQAAAAIEARLGTITPNLEHNHP